MDTAPFRFFAADAEGGEAAASVPTPAARPQPRPRRAAREEFPPACVPAGWRGERVEVAPGVWLAKADSMAIKAAAAALGLGASDLLPGVYEGGLKLWECALDLCAFLATDDATRRLLRAPPPHGVPATQPAGAAVLELGCGHGLPGVLAALLGARSAAFCDYNAEVLHALTAPALHASAPSSPAAAAARFFSGDWASLPALLPAGGFDLVLASDVGYDPATAPDLLVSLRHALRPGGAACALVALKAFYFGVGGGSAALAAACAGHGLRCAVARRLENGASNVREVLRITLA